MQGARAPNNTEETLILQFASRTVVSSHSVFLQKCTFVRLSTEHKSAPLRRQLEIYYICLIDGIDLVL